MLFSASLRWNSGGFGSTELGLSKGSGAGDAWATELDQSKLVVCHSDDSK